MACRRRVKVLTSHLCASQNNTGCYSLDGSKPQVEASAWVAPNAAVIGNVILKEDSSVWFGVTIRGDSTSPIVIGERSNVQDGEHHFLTQALLLSN